MLESEAYKTYLAYATGEKIPKPKYVKNKVDSESSPKKKTSTTAKGKRLKTSAKAVKPTKKKQPAKTSKAKGLTIGSDEGTGSKPRVPDVPTYRSDDEQISWKYSDKEDYDEVGLNDDDEDNDDDDDDADGQDDENQDDVNEQTDLDNDGPRYYSGGGYEVLFIRGVNTRFRKKKGLVRGSEGSVMIGESVPAGIRGALNANEWRLRKLLGSFIYMLPHAHYFETTFASSEQVEVLRNDTGYTIQSVQHNPGPGHPNTFYYSDSDESDDDEPSEMIEDQKSIHYLSGSPTPSDPETDTLLPHHDSTSQEVDDDKFDPEGEILFLEGLLNDKISSDPPPLELNNDSEGDILFLENLLKDEPLEVNKSEINPLIREPPNTFLMRDEEIKLNSHEDIDDLVPIPRNKESDESEMETIMDEVQINSTQSTAQIPPQYEKCGGLQKKAHSKNNKSKIDKSLLHLVLRYYSGGGNEVLFIRGVSTGSERKKVQYEDHKLSTQDQEVRHNEEESDEESEEENDEEIQGANVEEKELDEEETNDEDEANELYRDVNINLEGRDIE
ncbi:hypothetical protein Tco_1482016 [Tanacetum coccineum]